MSAGGFADKVINGLRSLSTWEFRLIFCLIAAVGIANAIFAAYQIGHTAAKEEMSILFSLPKASDSDFPIHLNTMRVSLAASFIIAAIGLWLRRAIGLILFTLAVIWVAIAYTWWYRDSLTYLRGLELPGSTSEINQIGLLRSATWWDIAVLILSAILLIWMVRIILISIRLSYAEHD